MPSKLPRVRTAILAGLAALSLGGVAAAATLPSTASAERAAQAASGADKAAASAHGAAASFAPGADAAGAADAAAGRSSDHATGPDASAAARRGLCQAWASGQGDDHGRRADAPAFQALADAAGGADQVAAYCAAETPTAADHGQRPETPPGGEHSNASPPTTGPPADPGDGNGHGQGGPPTTT